MGKEQAQMGMFPQFLLLVSHNVMCVFEGIYEEGKVFAWRRAQIPNIAWWNVPILGTIGFFFALKPSVFARKPHFLQ